MKISFRLLALLLAAALVGAAGVDVAARLLLDRAAEDQILGRLSAESALLSGQLDHDWPADNRQADSWARVTSAALGVRVTLIDARGFVLGDSEIPLAQLSTIENHLMRPEIVQAAAAGRGTARRHSATVGRDLLYLARRIGPAQAAQGFIRLATDSSLVSSATSRARQLLVLLALGALLIVCGISYAAVRRLSAPLAGLARAADQVASGHYTLSLDHDSEDEIGDLGHSMDRMRTALIEQIGHTESERRLLASILAGLHEGILVVNQERRVLLVNEALQMTFNITREIPEGTPLIQILWDRAILEAYDEALSTGNDVAHRISIPTGRAFELTVVPLSDGAGRHAGAIGLFFDVTRLEALERVRRDFVADISHELRTPLASMKASVETLQAGALDEPDEARRFLGILEKNTLRLEAIINDLTDLSLIETGSIAFVPESINLSGAAREVFSAISPKAAEKEVRLELDVPEGLCLTADRRRLDQILMNLLDNAVKFNRRGGSVKVSARAQDSTVVLTVEDTGPGIPPDALDRVFNRFYRVDRARSRDVSGTGLGLAIVKHLVRLHGGSIRAENREEAGTRFILILPGEAAPLTKS